MARAKVEGTLISATQLAEPIGKYHRTAFGAKVEVWTVLATWKPMSQCHDLLGALYDASGQVRALRRAAASHVGVHALLRVAAGRCAQCAMLQQEVLGCMHCTGLQQAVLGCVHWRTHCSGGCPLPTLRREGQQGCNKPYLGARTVQKSELWGSDTLAAQGCNKRGWGAWLHALHRYLGASGIGIWELAACSQYIVVHKLISAIAQLHVTSGRLSGPLSVPGPLPGPAQKPAGVNFAICGRISSCVSAPHHYASIYAICLETPRIRSHLCGVKVSCLQ